MSNLSLCSGDDLIELNKELDLWLKPQSKMTITITLPTLNSTGQSISSWELMEKLKKRAKPYHFKTLKVIKSTIEFLRFEGDCDSTTDLEGIMSRLNYATLKLSGFTQPLKVKSSKVKIGAKRHEWEAFFRDNPDMNEMRPGLRPDTIHLRDLPIKWFGGDKPSPNLLVKVFSVFGTVRRFHIPILDNDDSQQEQNTFKKFSFADTLSFEAYIQYRDYIGFVKAMDALRGMKLVKLVRHMPELVRHMPELNSENRFLEYDIKVDFDKTKYLSDKAIKRRKLLKEIGIESTVDLNKLKQETQQQRDKFETRIKFLKKRKQRGINLLTYLFSLVEKEEKDKIKAEEAKKADEQLKKRLLSEEVKLREKLIEKRREQLRLQAKGKLKSIATSSRTTSSSDQIQTYESTQDVPSTSHHNHHHHHQHHHHVHNHHHNLHNHHSQSKNLFLNQKKRIISIFNSNKNNVNNNNANSNTEKFLYKNHKKGCKYYKPKSLIVNRKDENK